MICPNCQTANPDPARFCMNCGTPLRADPIAPTDSIDKHRAPASPDILGRYLPPELIHKLEAVRARGAMAGERRVITMLFCDVKGSTAAAGQVDPEIWTEIMNGAFERMIRPIYRFEGTVARLMGDAILAFFGAPIAHEDDPQRAVWAGLEIQAAMAPYIRSIRQQYDLDFGLRVGINTGLVVVGEIGSDLRVEYSAIGDAINVAARMEQTAAPGTVQVAEETYRLISPLFDFEPLGGVEVKGKSEPMTAYRVLGRKAQPGSLRGLAGLSSPLVGREGPLDLLGRRLAGLRRGDGGFVALIGEAGLGKSSLVTQAWRESGSGVAWLKGEAISHSRSVSYYPWRQIIRSSIRAREEDPPAAVQSKLREQCDCCKLPGSDIPFLEAMLAIESEESLQLVAGYQGDALVERVTEAARGYLCGLAREGPLVLVLDDLHWADESSLALLANASDLAAEQAILFVCMLRPDRDAPAASCMQLIGSGLGPRYSVVGLEPLRYEQTDAMLTNLLGPAELPAELRETVIQRASGNPFFMEELVRSLIETRQIVQENGRWRAAAREVSITVPDTLRGVLGARIDRLAEPHRHILQVGAVIGRTFDLRVLQRLVPREGLDAAVAVLQDAGILEWDAHGNAMFRHVLLQEAAYESILLKNRRGLHRQVGEALEQLHAGRLEEFAPLLAHHFHAAGDDRSLRYDLLAGDKAARLYANVEAAYHYQRALDTARRIDVPSAQAEDIYSRLGGVLELAGQHERALATYDDMLAFARQRTDRAMEIRALMAKATIYSIYSQQHNAALSEDMLKQALRISDELGDRAIQAKLNWNLMLAHLFSKRLPQALAYGERALALGRRAQAPEQLAYVLNDLCRLYVCLGRFEEAFAVIHEARDLWAALDSRPMYIDSLGAEAEARFNHGELQAALDLTSQAARLSDETRNVWGQAYNRMLMGFVLADLGEVGAAIEAWEYAIRQSDRGSLLATTIGTRTDLAWIYGFYGGLERGLALADEALAAAAAKQPGWIDLPRAVKVRLHLLAGDVRSAAAVAGSSMLEPISIPYARFTVVIGLANAELSLKQKDGRQALSLVEDLIREVSPITGPDMPEILRVKGEILLALARADEAAAVLEEACARSRLMGARHHLWPALRVLAQAESRRGRPELAAAHRAEAADILGEIAGRLQDTGLRDALLKRAGA